LPRSQGTADPSGMKVDLVSFWSGWIFYNYHCSTFWFFLGGAGFCSMSFRGPRFLGDNERFRLQTLPRRPFTRGVSLPFLRFAFIHCTNPYLILDGLEGEYLNRGSLKERVCHNVLDLSLLTTLTLPHPNQKHLDTSCPFLTSSPRLRLRHFSGLVSSRGHIQLSQAALLKH